LTDEADDPTDGDIMHCSFCNKSQFEIERLVAGRSATICDACVRVCLDIVGPEPSPGSLSAPAHHVNWPGGVYCSLCHDDLEDDAVVVEGRGLICTNCGVRVGEALVRQGKWRA
jgi:hypothetical protein